MKEQFTETELRQLHKLCMIKLISKARMHKANDDILEHAKLTRAIKVIFFDKIYWKRGFSYCPITNLYTWDF